MTEEVFVQPVVLLGGSGTRLWPLSRAGFPKQFLCLNDELSLFQKTINRLASVENIISKSFKSKKTLVVCNEEHRFIAREQLREIGVDCHIILEPFAKNTAPALTLAAISAMKDGDDPVLVVMPSDHLIRDENYFSSIIRDACEVSLDGSIVTLGIKPTKPETGYGYIKYSKKTNSNVGDVLGFFEKPTLEKAKYFLEDGDFYWNSGIFILKASVWVNSIKCLRPDIYDSVLSSINEANLDTEFLRPSSKIFGSIHGESIDYAVIENTETIGVDLKMIPFNSSWSDMGSWDSIWEASEKDQQGNVLEGDVIVRDCSNSYIISKDRLISAIGLDDIAIVDTSDALLIVNKKKCQDIKIISEILKSEGRSEYSLHRKVIRPWGWYDSIDEDKRFKVKRISVKPGGSLSLQKHFHRAEHWVVVSGTAQVTKGKETIILTENQSVYISLGEVHRLANPGKIPLEIIEVQSGSYLEEDDIIRFDDVYGR